MRANNRYKMLEDPLPDLDQMLPPKLIPILDNKKSSSLSNGTLDA